MSEEDRSALTEILRKERTSMSKLYQGIRSGSVLLKDARQSSTTSAGHAVDCARAWAMTSPASSTLAAAESWTARADARHVAAGGDFGFDGGHRVGDRLTPGV